MFISYNKYNKFTKKNYFFEVPSDNVEWCSFRNGPIINKINNIKIYKKNEEDGKINLNFNEWDKDLQKIFHLSFSLLESFSVLRLIEESHLTDPWKNNSFEEKDYKDIPTKEIREWFKENVPFFLKK